MVIRRAREDPIGGAVNRRARLGRARVEAVERGGKSVDPVDPSSGGWFREQVVAPEDDEPELGRRLPSLLTAPSRGWCGSGKPRTSAASRGNPASRARSRVYVDMWEAPDRRPSAEPSRQVVLGRHSTEARRGVVSQPVTATRANRWLTSRATPTRHKRVLPLSGLSQIMLSAGRAEELAPRASESSVPPFGHRRLRLIAHPEGRALGRTWQRRRNATPPSSSSAPVRKRGASCHEPLSRHQSLAVDLVRKLLSGEVGTSDPPR